MANQTITINEIFKYSESTLVLELIDAGLPHEKAHRAFLYLRELTKNYIKSELQTNGTKNLILVLTGFSEEKELMETATLQFTLTLNSELGIDHNRALDISNKIVPQALQCIGDQMSWSKMNEVGLQQLLMRSGQEEESNNHSKMKRILGRALKLLS